MLIDILGIEQGLQAAGIECTPRHDDIMLLGRKDLLRVFLRSDGEVQRISVLPGEQAQKHWTLRKGKQNSFPRVPLRDKTKQGGERDRAPLRPNGNAELLKLLADRKRPLPARFDAFRKLCDSTPLKLERFQPWPGGRSQIELWARRIGAFATPSIKVLFDVFAMPSGGTKLLEKIDARIREELGETPDQSLFELSRNLLFHEGGAVLLDAWVDGDPKPACHPDHIALLTRALEGDASLPAETGVCALSGVVGPLQTGALSPAKLPVMGETTLFAKYPGYVDSGKRERVPNCVFRYGRAWSEGFPINADLAARLRVSAEEIAGPAREGKTWSKLGQSFT
jgi:hypothetical protein